MEDKPYPWPFKTGPGSYIYPKSSEIRVPFIIFNDSSAKEKVYFQLDFQKIFQISTKKVNKSVAILRKFHNVLPRSILLSIYNILLELILIMVTLLW